MAPISFDKPIYAYRANATQFNPWDFPTVAMLGYRQETENTVIIFYGRRLLDAERRAYNMVELGVTTYAQK
jgi:hypothetical protein